MDYENPAEACVGALGDGSAVDAILAGYPQDEEYDVEACDGCYLSLLARHFGYTGVSMGLQWIHVGAESARVPGWAVGWQQQMLIEAGAGDPDYTECAPITVARARELLAEVLATAKGAGA